MGDVEQLRALLSFFACPYAPFDQLFPRSAAIVHNGGIGTVAHALAAGKPQLVTAFGFDQPDNGCRLIALDAGDLLMASALSPKKLTQKLGSLVASEDTKRKARTIGEKMTADETVPVERACELVEGV